MVCKLDIGRPQKLRRISLSSRAFDLASNIFLIFWTPFRGPPNLKRRSAGPCLELFIELFSPSPSEASMHPTPVLAAVPADNSSSELLSASTPIDLANREALAPGHSTQEPGEQFLLILSGLIGSGKSTFARALTQHYPNWTRCNQDELGDRHAVVYAARNAFLAGKNVIIDRTNIDAKQRRTWLELAQELRSASPPIKIVTVSLTLTISLDLAEERLRVRVGHETIKTAEQAMEILPHFLRSYQKATVEEGFHYVLTYPAARMSPEPTREEVESMLFAKLETDVRGEGKLPERPPTRGAGGRGRGRGRGEWRGRGRGASAVYTPHHQHQHQPYPQRQPRQDQAATEQGGSLSVQAPPSFAAAAAVPPPSAPAEPDMQPQL